MTDKKSRLVPVDMQEHELRWLSQSGGVIHEIYNRFARLQKQIDALKMDDKTQMMTDNDSRPAAIDSTYVYSIIKTHCDEFLGTFVQPLINRIQFLEGCMGGVEQVKIQVMKENFKVPTHAKAGDVGWDLYACDTAEIPAETTRTFPVGFRMELPKNYWAKIETRSSMAKIEILAVGGIIDSGYRGEIMVMLRNNGKYPYHVQEGQAIAQLIIHRVMENEGINWQLADELTALSITERGEKGFGSSDKIKD